MNYTLSSADLRLKFCHGAEGSAGVLAMAVLRGVDNKTLHRIVFDDDVREAYRELDDEIAREVSWSSRELNRAR